MTWFGLFSVLVTQRRICQLSFNWNMHYCLLSTITVLDDNIYGVSLQNRLCSSRLRMMCECHLCFSFVLGFYPLFFFSSIKGQSTVCWVRPWSWAILLHGSASPICKQNVLTAHIQALWEANLESLHSNQFTCWEIPSRSYVNSGISLTKNGTSRERAAMVTFI